MSRPLALLVGLLVAAPAIWGALVTGSVPTGTALERTVIALVVVSVAGVAIESLLNAYAPVARPEPLESTDTPARRRTDVPGAEDPTAVISTRGAS